MMADAFTPQQVAERYEVGLDVNDLAPSMPSQMPADERDQLAELAYWARRGIRPEWADRIEDPRAAIARLERRVAALEAAQREGGVS